MTEEEANELEMKIISDRLYRDEEKYRNIGLIIDILYWYKNYSTKSYKFYGTQYKDIKVIVNSIGSILPSTITIEYGEDYIILYR